jgi:hypothetical protein
MFLAARSTGVSIHDRKPMPAAALTGYISIHGQLAVFPARITFCSIRRRIATDLVDEFGNDAAREIIGHTPMSRGLETSYLEFNNLCHTTAVALGETTEGQEAERRAALHQQLLRRIDEDLLLKSRGGSLQCPCPGVASGR